MTETPLTTGHTIYVMRRVKQYRATPKPKPTDEGTTEEPSSSSAPDVDDYEKNIKKIATFRTVEQFWRVYGHVRRPSDVPHITDLHVFREGIKPVWEDPANKRGGKLVVKVKKGLGSRYWELLLLGVIGEQFGEFSNEVCGVVISVRHNEDVLSLWTRNREDAEAVGKIREVLKKVLKLPGFVSIEFKPHETAEAAKDAAGGSGGTGGQYGGRAAPAWRLRSSGGGGRDQEIPAWR